MQVDPKSYGSLVTAQSVSEVSGIAWVVGGSKYAWSRVISLSEKQVCVLISVHHFHSI
jgi:hypothetical protein